MGLFNGLFNKSIKGDLKRFHYSPGYCDMLGACHYSTLEKNENGKWIFVTGDREQHSDPVTVKTYAVSDEAAAEFGAFIIQQNFLDLTNRPKNRGFITDYSPWSYNIDLDCSADGGSSCEYFSIGQYHEYSNKDDELMEQVLAKFNALKGELISEVKENG